MNILRIFLFPFAIIYGIIIWFWKKLYEWGVLHSFQFDVPVISVGNLSAGGTGKTPMVEYLIHLLEKNYRVATLSRGYGRKTRGYFFAVENSSANDIGDEPKQFKTKFPATAVGVAENRSLGIPNLLGDAPETEVILLDDAFQSLSVKPGLSILLTDFSKLFFNDYLLPAGRLREFRSGYNRADIIIVTKCPRDISGKRRNYILSQIKPFAHQQVYFSTLNYGFPYSLQDNNKSLILNKKYEVLLFCGIANPGLLEDYLKEQTNHVTAMTFSDHHRYTHHDMGRIKNELDKISLPEKIIITTEKDAMRLEEYKEWIKENQLPVYCLPVQMEFINDEGQFFNEFILNFLKTNGKPD